MDTGKVKLFFSTYEDFSSFHVFQQKIVTRRNTIASAIAPSNSLEDVQQISSSRRMTPEEEDILLAEIIKHFETIENKATDRSLTPKKLQDKNTQAWEQIRISFIEKTGVRFCFDFILKILQ